MLSICYDHQCFNNPYIICVLVVLAKFHYVWEESSLSFHRRRKRLLPASHGAKRHCTHCCQKLCPFLPEMWGEDGGSLAVCVESLVPEYNEQYCSAEAQGLFWSHPSISYTTVLVFRSTFLDRCKHLGNLRLPTKMPENSVGMQTHAAAVKVLQKNEIWLKLSNLSPTVDIAVLFSWDILVPIPLGFCNADLSSI